MSHLRELTGASLIAALVDEVESLRFQLNEHLAVPPKRSSPRIRRRRDRPDQSENPQPGEMSFCIDCRQWLPNAEFYQYRDSGRIACYCKECNSNRVTQYSRLQRKNANSSVAPRQ